MSKSASSPSSSDSSSEKNVTPGFEEKLQQFWERNQKLLLALCVVVMLAIVARGAWDYLAAAKERSLEREFSTASAKPETLKAFAEANAGHELAGVAWLQLGDQAYAAEKGAEAVADYQKAAAVLKAGPLADRTQLGLAMAQLQAGQTDAAKAALKQIVDNDRVFNGVRVEAAYQLASLAHVAGKSAEVQQLSERIMQIDPASPWAQRAMMLRAEEPVATATAVTAPVAGKEAKSADKAEPVIKLNLPSTGGK